MAVWLDPLLPKLATPSWAYLREHPVRFGRLELVLTQSQWDFTFAQEKFLGWVGGARSGKSVGGVSRGLKCSLFIPNNRGLVGRLAETDLQDTDQREFYEYADRTGMVKSKSDRKLVLYCCDIEGRILPGKPTSEVLFRHFANENHLKGHGVGWWHMAEGSEMGPKVMHRLTDRLSLPAARGQYTGFITSNPEGRNWIYDHFYNKAKVEAQPKEARLSRRGIHNRTKDNPFLSEEYLQMQYNNSPAEWIRRYMEGEFDVFEGQIFSEFSHEIHCVQSFECKGWEGHEPPKNWKRTLGIDTGGADPWAFEASAVDPWGNLIFYNEIYRATAATDTFGPELRQIMDGRNFTAFPMDWENKQAQHELSRIGIRVTNAHKRDKVKKSFALVWRYLHPNPERIYPEWHPRAGQPGSPGMFFTERVPNLVREFPQQRWKKLAGSDIELNEPDSKISDHAVDALYYTCREHPRPEETLLKVAAVAMKEGIDLRSAYFLMNRKAEEERRQNARTNTASQLIPPLRQAPKGEQPLWN